MAAVERKNNRPPPAGAPGVFYEMLEKSCPYHRGSIKHTLQECSMTKRYFSGSAKGKGNQRQKPGEDKGEGGEKDDGFPIVNNCFMIFGGPVAYDTKRQRKLER
jgi:hypothetical protein